MKGAIRGTGAYGIALSLMFHKHHENSIKMWTKFEEEKNSILVNRENEKVLKGVKIPKDIEISTDFDYVVGDAEIVVVAVPQFYANSVLCGGAAAVQCEHQTNKKQKYLFHDTIILNG